MLLSDSRTRRCSVRAATQRQGARLPMPRTNHAARGHAPRRPPREHALRLAPGSGSAAAGLQPGAGPVAPAGNNDIPSSQEPPFAGLCTRPMLALTSACTGGKMQPHLRVRHGFAAVHLACCQERSGTRDQHLARPAQASQARRYRCHRCHRSRMSWSAWRPSGPSLRMQAGAVIARSASWPP